MHRMCPILYVLMYATMLYVIMYPRSVEVHEVHLRFVVDFLVKVAVV